MTRPLRIEYPGALYHVTARGNARQPIFADETDPLELISAVTLSLQTQLFPNNRFEADCSPAGGILRRLKRGVGRTTDWTLLQTARFRP